MANSPTRTVEVATQAAHVAERVVDVLNEVKDLLEYNSDQAIDWAAQETPAYIPEDANGNIDGLPFSRQAVANAIGSLDQLRRLLMGESVSQGDHLGTLNTISSAS